MQSPMVFPLIFLLIFGYCESKVVARRINSSQRIMTHEGDNLTLVCQQPSSTNGTGAHQDLYNVRWSKNKRMFLYFGSITQIDNVAIDCSIPNVRVISPWEIVFENVGGWVLGQYTCLEAVNPKYSGGVPEIRTTTFIVSITMKARGFKTTTPEPIRNPSEGCPPDPQNNIGSLQFKGHSNKETLWLKTFTGLPVPTTTSPSPINGDGDKGCTLYDYFLLLASQFS